MERTDFPYYNNSNNMFVSSKKKNRNKEKDKDKNNQRRFSDDQIKQLETMFESETRLEPRKKIEVARELGLQPRQVAIWFQNKRARWKSKQVEQDLKALRTEYESLASKFESLKQEKHSLISQLEKLNDELVRKEKDGSTSKISDDDDKSGLAKLSLEEGLEERGGFEINDIEDWSHYNQGYDDHDDDELVMINTTSQEQNDVYSLASFDQPRGCSQWLNFWC